MAVRTDVTVDWHVSPRLVTVLSPSTTISCQDLVDTLRDQEAWQTNLEHPALLDQETGGKTAMSGGKFTGITAILSDCKLQFEARGGPGYEQCSVTGGNLAALDDLGVQTNPINPTAFTQVVVEQDTSAALISTDALTLSQFLALK